jgi:hypothetical protein
MPQPTAWAAKARGGVGRVRVGAHQLAGARPLQLAAPEHQAVDALAAGAQASRRRCIWAPSKPGFWASLPVARSRAAPAMRDTRFKVQRPFEV